MSRVEQAILVKVVRTVREGNRVYLELSCGHRKLTNPRHDAPRRAYCYEPHV